MNTEGQCCMFSEHKVIIVESNHGKFKDRKEKYSSYLTGSSASAGQLKTIYRVGKKTMKVENMGKKITFKVRRLKNFQHWLDPQLTL